MRRLACLDGLRGVLATYVLLSHMAPFGALPLWLSRPFSHGEAAVDVFFILSGMVIARSLTRFDNQPAPFLLARAARLLPVFFVVFPIAVAIQPLGRGFDRMPWIGLDSTARTIWSEDWPSHWAPEIAAHLTMTHGLFPDVVLPNAWVSFLGAAWSLSTEWQFYALVAVLAYRNHSLRYGMLVLLAVAVAAIAWSSYSPRPSGSSAAPSSQTRHNTSPSALRPPNSTEDRVQPRPASTPPSCSPYLPCAGLRPVPPSSPPRSSGPSPSRPSVTVDHWRLCCGPARCSGSAPSPTRSIW